MAEAEQVSQFISDKFSSLVSLQLLRLSLPALSGNK